MVRIGKPIYHLREGGRPEASLTLWKSLRMNEAPHCLVSVTEKPDILF
jgi:hypothetical protein